MKQEQINMQKNTLEVVPADASLAVARTPPTVADMMQTVIQGGVTQENVVALEKLVGLYERMQDKEAEKAFAGAFVNLQSEMQNVKAVRSVPDNRGGTRYKFAPYEEIMQEVGPRLKANGFTITFSTDYSEGRLIKTCRLQHIGGHSKENKFAVRIGSGPPGTTETQADGAASTYAKRGALCDALNIVIERDDDAKAEGGAITAEQAKDLRRRVQETGSNEEHFLKFAGSATYEAISTSKYAMLDESLRKKEKTNR